MQGLSGFQTLPDLNACFNGTHPATSIPVRRPPAVPRKKYRTTPSTNNQQIAPNKVQGGTRQYKTKTQHKYVSTGGAKKKTQKEKKLTIESRKEQKLNEDELRELSKRRAVPRNGEFTSDLFRNSSDLMTIISSNKTRNVRGIYDHRPKPIRRVGEFEPNTGASKQETGKRKKEVEQKERDIKAHIQKRQNWIVTKSKALVSDPLANMLNRGWEEDYSQRRDAIFFGGVDPIDAIEAKDREVKNTYGPNRKRPGAKKKTKGKLLSSTVIPAIIGIPGTQRVDDTTIENRFVYNRQNAGEITFYTAEEQQAYGNVAPTNTDIAFWVRAVIKMGANDKLLVHLYHNPNTPTASPDVTYCVDSNRIHRLTTILQQALSNGSIPSDEQQNENSERWVEFVQGAVAVGHIGKIVVQKMLLDHNASDTYPPRITQHHEFKNRSLGNPYANEVPENLDGYDENDDVYDDEDGVDGGAMQNVMRANRPNGSGRYFRERHTVPELIDILNRYQVYFIDNNRPNKDPNCMIHALRLSGVDELLLTQVCSTFVGCTENFKMSNLQALTNMIRQDIMIIKDVMKGNTSCNKRRTAKYVSNNPFVPPKSLITIGLIKGHAFIYETGLLVSQSFLRHYDKFGDCDKDNKTILTYEGREHGGRGRFRLRVNTSLCDSFSLIRNLELFGHLEMKENDECTVDTIAKTKCFSILSPALLEFCQKPFDKKKAKDEDEDETDPETEKTPSDSKEELPVRRFACDLECITIEGQSHEACLAGVFEIRTNDEREDGSKCNYNEGDEMNKTKIFGVGRTNSEDVLTDFFTYIKSFATYASNKVKNKFPRQTNEIVLYFHNAKYDCNVLMNHPDITPIQLIRRETTLYSITVSYKRCKMKICDSMKLFGVSSLASLPSDYSLPKWCQKQECINYNYYRFDNKNQNVSMLNYLKGKPYSENKQYDIDMANLKSILTANTTLVTSVDDNGEIELFDPWALYVFYLKFDCIVLGCALQELYYHMKTLTGMNCLKYLTISRFTSEWMKSRGCFDDAIESHTALRAFRQQNVYGGRIDVHPQALGYPLTDFETTYWDYVSLYPTAIKSVCDEYGGFPTGKSEVLPSNMSASELLSFPFHFIAQIRVFKAYRDNKCGMNIICVRPEDNKPVKDENGNINENEDDSFSDTLLYLGAFDRTDNPITMTIDRVTLQEYQYYHGLEFEVVQGEFWRTQSTTWGCVIEELFNQRLHFKQQGCDALQLLCKLMLNSSYGRTCLRASDENSRLLGNNKTDQFILNNFVNIKEVRKTGVNCKEIILNEVDKSSTLNHWGSLVLSYSKRVVNRFYNVCNCLGAPILYTDTDSLLIFKRDEENIVNCYRNLYQSELVGEKLGQAHSDFSIKNPETGKKVPNNIIDQSNLVSKCSILVGKKQYLHVVEAFHPELKRVIKNVKISMKGCTERGVRHAAISLLSVEQLEFYKTNEQEGIIPGYVNLFEKMCQGELISIPLNPNGTVRFTYNRQGFGVSTSSTQAVKLIGMKSSVKEFRQQNKKLRRNQALIESEEEEEVSADEISSDEDMNKVVDSDMNYLEYDERTMEVEIVDFE